MVSTCNSSRTNRLLQRVSSQDGQALEDLFGLHRERLRKMVRLRLDRRLRAQFTSSMVLEQVDRDACKRIDEYLADPRQRVFLWLRLLTGQRIRDRHTPPKNGTASILGHTFSTQARISRSIAVLIPK